MSKTIHWKHSSFNSTWIHLAWRVKLLCISHRSLQSMVFVAFCRRYANALTRTACVWKSFVTTRAQKRRTKFYIRRNTREHSINSWHFIDLTSVLSALTKVIATLRFHLEATERRIPQFLETWDGNEVDRLEPCRTSWENYEARLWVDAWELHGR